MKRLRTLMSVIVLLVTSSALHAQPSCLSGPELVENTRSYMTWRWTNHCGTSVKVHWTRQGETRTETGSWFVAKCETSQNQYFPGQYSFSYEFDQSGVSRTCLGRDNDAKRDEKAAKPAQDKNRQQALERAKQAAAAARGKAREATRREQQRSANKEAERRRIKQTVTKLGSGCQDAIQACERQAESLKASAQSQCRAYCQSMRAAHCNLNSSSLSQAGQTCSYTARQEHQQVARTAKLEREEKAKWECFGERGNVREGFDQCKRECEEYHSSQHCQRTCFASGDGSIANGRSCFRRP